MTRPYNPFVRVLDGGGYLDLLHLGRGSDRTIEQIAIALSEPGAAGAYNEFMSQSGWRPHLVGAVAAMLDRDRRLDPLALWNAADAGSWVTPQLVVAALFTDPQFTARVQQRIELRCPIHPPSQEDVPPAPSVPPPRSENVPPARSVPPPRGSWFQRGFKWLGSRLKSSPPSLDLLVRHVTDGPGTGATRSAKLMASVLGVCHRVPALADQETAWRNDPEVAAILAQDVDASDKLAAQWMRSAETAFLQRGIQLRPQFM